MIYLLSVSFMVVIPLGLGYKVGNRLATWLASHKGISAVAVVGMALAWLGLAFWARHYADGDRLGWAWAEWFAHRGKWYLFTYTILFFLGVTLRDQSLDRKRITAVLVIEVLMIWLFVWRTMPSYVWLSHTNKRDAAGHLRQSIEHTCAPVSLGNLVEVHHGMDAPSERTLAKWSITTREGTPLTGLMAAARKLGLELKTCKVMDLAELRKLQSPAIVQISTLPSVKHATLLLRIEGDEAHFIDPAYGYRKVSCARFQQTWYGKTIIFAEKQ